MSENATSEEIRAVFACNPNTGVLIWRKAKASIRGRVAGSITPGGYRVVCWRGRGWPAHRLLWAHVHGVFPSGELDHINGDRLDNRLCNLREVTSTENKRNCARSKNNTSGVRGVSWHKRNNKWQAKIKVDYRSHFLGFFQTIEEAARARKDAEAHFGFHPNHGRDPATQQGE